MDALIPAWNGELLIELGGADVSARPTFEALRSFETSTRSSVYVAAGEFESGVPRVSTIAAVVCACVNAAGGRSPQTGLRWTIDEVGALILGPGLSAYAEMAAALIAHWLSGGRQGRAAVGEASAAVRMGLLKRIDGQPVTSSAITSGPPVAGPTSNPVTSGA